MDNAALPKDDKQKKYVVYELSAPFKIPVSQFQSMACGESVADHAILRRAIPMQFHADAEANADIDGGGGAAKHDDKHDDDSDSDYDIPELIE